MSETETPVEPTPKKTRQHLKKREEKISISRAELDAIIAQAVQAHSPGGNPAVADAFAAALKQQGEQGQKAVELLLAAQPLRSLELMQTPRISHYNPLGDRDHPRPALVDAAGKPRKTLFCGSDLTDMQDRMTREEIEALNAITQDCELQKPGGKWTARIRHNGTTEELHIELPMGNKDVYLHFPPVLQICQELKMGKKLVDLNNVFATMIAHSADPEAFIAALQKLGAQPMVTA